MPQYNQYVQYALDRQPENENLLQTTGFRFVLSKSPQIVYFCQSTMIPSISVSVTDILGKHPTLHIPDPKITYEPLMFTFLVNEDMGNWLEIYNWMKQMSLPDEGITVRDFKKIRTTVEENRANSYETDGTLVILNNNSRPQASITFKDMFPSSLGEIEFNAADGDATQVTCTATFQYRSYSVEIY